MSKIETVGDLLEILRRLDPTVPVRVVLRDGPITEYADGRAAPSYYDNFDGPWVIGDVEQTVAPDAPDDAIPTVMIWGNKLVEEGK